MFRCYSCSKIILRRFNPDRDYEIVIQGDGWEKTKRVCEKCGEEFDSVYTENKNIKESLK